MILPTPLKSQAEHPGPNRRPLFENNPAPGNENLPEAAGIRAVGPDNPLGGLNLDDEPVGTSKEDSLDVVPKEPQTVLPEQAFDSTVMHLRHDGWPEAQPDRSGSLRAEGPTR